MKDNIAEQEFIPSQRLIDLVDEKMARPEGEEWAMFEEILSKIPEEEMNKRMVEIITEQVEGFFVSNARCSRYDENLALVGD